MIQERNIGLYIVLTLVTCGIFGLYWLVVITEDMNSLAEDGDNTDGALVLLLTIVTCGIYGLYWAYKQGQRIDKLNGMQGGSTGILYLILNFIGLSLVTYALLQNELNKRANIPE